ncbi:O-antigen ligase family protein [Leptolyngbya sp. AN03gr2]|uniref:O-antigen ligase family protein n=1 Tax=unclassified Leptolyngbya TaxID=2650499 RepID=UPI003D31F121
MKLRDLQLLAQKIEPWLVGIYLIYFLGIAVPPRAVGIANAASYGILFILLVISGCWRQLLFGMTRDIPLLALHLMSVVSILWSVAPEFTADEPKAFLRAGLFGVYLAVRFGLTGQMMLLARIMGIAVFLSLLAGIVAPSYGIETMGESAGFWKGIFQFKNLFASNMAFAVLTLLLFGLSRPKWRGLVWGLGAIAFALLLLSRGKTGLASLLITLYLLPFLGVVKQYYKTRVVSVALILITSLIGGLLVFLNLRFIVVEVLGKSLEFNGRLPLWSMMLDKGLDHFWLGHGYAAFWTSGASFQILTQTWAYETYRLGIRFNAHNGYIDLFLQLGIVGLSLYLISLGTLFFRAIYLLMRQKSIEVFWVLLTLVLSSLLSFADSLSVGTGGAMWSLYVAFSTSIAIQYRRLKIDDRISETNPPEPSLAPNLSAANLRSS